MLDGYDIMNKEFNVVASRSLKGLQKSNSVGEENFLKVLDNHKGLEGYKASVISSYYKDGDENYKSEADKYVKEFRLTTNEINYICNSSIEPSDVDCIIAQSAVLYLCKNKSYDFAIDFLKSTIKNVEETKKERKK